MTHPYSRKIDNIDLIEHFLATALNYENSTDNILLKKIQSGEAELKNYDYSTSTLASTANRNRNFKSNIDRLKLRRQIVEELFQFVALDNDEEISLGHGGSLPKSSICKEKQSFILIGLPASGKSSVAKNLANYYGAIVLDSVLAKRKLPEFVDNPAGASLVHEESNNIIFGFSKNEKLEDFHSLFDLCCQNEYNIIIPKIGYNFKSVNLLCKSLKLLGYTTHLVLISLDRRKATIRAITRFIKTGRYVPLSLIFDGYSNEPTLSYYRLKHNVDNESIFIDTFAKISTDVEFEKAPKLIFADDNSPIKELYS